MSSMLDTIVPKSDQLNFDDFIGGQSKTIKITNVSISAKEQPVSLNYEGDKGKPFKPCKSMCRVLIYVWGPDAKAYIGRSLTLYGDPKVRFGGAEVGGTRISHMSHITQPITMALTASKSIRKPFTVQPLVISEALTADDYIADIQTVPTMDGLKHKFAEASKAFKGSADYARITEAKEKRKTELSNNPTSPPLNPIGNPSPEGAAPSHNNGD